MKTLRDPNNYTDVKFNCRQYTSQSLIEEAIMRPETKHRILWISVIVLFALCITEGFLLFGKSKSEESGQLSLAGLADRIQGVEGLSGEDFEEEIDRIKREVERFREEIEESVEQTLKSRRRRRTDEGPEDLETRHRRRSRGGEIEVTQEDEPEALVVVLKSPRLLYENLDVDVEVDEKKISVHGETKSGEQSEGRDNKTYSRRRTARRFTRTFPTPEGVDASSAEIEVDVDEGEIRIRFPKTRT